MSDPAEGGKTALAFMPLYQAAQASTRGDPDPCTLESFAMVHAEMSFRLDSAGNKVDHHVVLADNGFEHHSRLEGEGYWTPIVGAPTILGEPNPRFDAARSQEYEALLWLTLDAHSGMARSENEDLTDAEFRECDLTRSRLIGVVMQDAAPVSRPRLALRH